MSNSLYKQVSIHEETVNKIDSLIQRLDKISTAPHFTSRADFVKHAINKEINSLNQIYRLADSEE